MTVSTNPTDTEPAPPLKVKIAGMDCGSCAITIENSVRKIAGVTQANVSFTTESLEVEGDVELDVIAARLHELGYKITNDNHGPTADLPSHHGASGFLRFLWQQPPLRTAICTAIVVIFSTIALADTQPIYNINPLDALLAIAVIVSGAPVFLKGFRAILFANRITIDLLMAIAATGALAIGEYGEAITVILLFITGEALEAYSAERARDSLRSLIALQPQEATVLQPHNDNGCEHNEGTSCHTQVIPVDQVEIGHCVLVRPGQRIPVDGTVIKGESCIDQSAVTGESVPVLKNIGDNVMAGTVNGEAALEIRSTQIASQGTIARIAKLVEQAQAQRSPAERFIDKFARWYTPTVVALATLIVFIPVYGFEQPLMNTHDTTGWLYRGLAILIIACPCALVISIPVTVVSGLTRLANLGILVKSGAQLDRVTDIKAIAFDKTGTLTYGKPQVTAIRTLKCSHQTTHDASCQHCDNIIAIAAAIEQSSEHPVAHAIVQAAKNRCGVGHIGNAQSVQAHPGKGVSGMLANNKIVVGTGSLFNHTMRGWNDISRYASTAQNKGETVMYVAENDKIIGYIAVHDEIRPLSHDAIAKLNRMDIHTVMLTGDNKQTAERVAEKITGINEIHAQLLPEDKLIAIENTRKAFGAVAMVGDGINDAPALARADIGIAMGGDGTAQAMEVADIVLMQDDLTDVSLALRIARKSRSIIKQNIVLSLALKITFLSLAIPGLATLWMAVLADVGATLLVTLNGMRLLKAD